MKLLAKIFFELLTVFDISPDCSKKRYIDPKAKNPFVQGGKI